LDANKTAFLVFLQDDLTLALRQGIRIDLLTRLKPPL